METGNRRTDKVATVKPGRGVSEPAGVPKQGSAGLILHRSRQPTPPKAGASSSALSAYWPGPVPSSSCECDNGHLVIRHAFIKAVSTRLANEHSC